MVLRKILMELFVIFAMVGLQLLVNLEDCKTLYSRNEQKWVSETFTELIFVFAGFTIFRAATINLGSSTNEFVAKCVGLIFFQLAMNICFILIQFRGIQLNKSIFEREGYQTEDGRVENLFIHTTRIILLVIGSFVSFSVFVIICSIILFVITVGVLQRDGHLLSASERVAWR